MSQGVKADRDLLKQYLNQYHVAREQRRLLEQRCVALRAELRCPSVASSLRSDPPVSGAVGDGAMAVVFRIAEVEEHLARQYWLIQQTIAQTLDLISILPPASLKRSIVELRHVDCLGWGKVAASVHLSRSAVYNYYNAALDDMLADDRTRQVLQNFPAAL